MLIINNTIIINLNKLLSLNLSKFYNISISKLSPKLSTINITLLKTLFKNILSLSSFI